MAQRVGAFSPCLLLLAALSRHSFAIHSHNRTRTSAKRRHAPSCGCFFDVAHPLLVRARCDRRVRALRFAPRKTRAPPPPTPQLGPRISGGHFVMMRPCSSSVLRRSGGSVGGGGAPHQRMTPAATWSRPRKSRHESRCVLAPHQALALTHGHWHIEMQSRARDVRSRRGRMIVSRVRRIGMIALDRRTRAHTQAQRIASQRTHTRFALPTITFSFLGPDFQKTQARLRRRRGSVVVRWRGGQRRWRRRRAPRAGRGRRRRLEGVPRKAGRGRGGFERPRRRVGGESSHTPSRGAAGGGGGRPLL